jgi:DNA-directed RNA polymerase subunit K/omega
MINGGDFDENINVGGSDDGSVGGSDDGSVSSGGDEKNGGMSDDDDDDDDEIQGGDIDDDDDDAGVGDIDDDYNIDGDDIDDDDDKKRNSENIIMENNINYEESDDDDLDEDYLQKIDKETQSSIIKEYHPEMIVHNRDEIKTSCHIIRNSQGNIIDPLHKTLPFVTSYERARVIGERAKQIESGAKPFIEIPSNMIDGYLIALKEFESKKIPFIIQRPLPNGTSEYWKLSDLEII